MNLTVVYEWERKVGSLLETFLSGKNWKIASLIFFVLYIYVTSFPPFHQYSDHEFDFLVSQSRSPLAPIPDEFYNPHVDKHAFRLTVPLIGKIFMLPPVGFFILSQLCAAALLYCLLLFIWNISRDRVTSFLFTFAISSVFIGKWGFYDMYAHFDALALLLMVLAVIQTQHLPVILLLLLSYFTDERALISSSLVYLLFFFQEEDYKMSIKNFITFRKKRGAVLISWLVYAVIRLCLQYFTSLKITGSEVGTDIFLFNYKFAPLSLILAYEGFLLIIFIFIFTLIQRKERLSLTLLLAGIGLVWMVALLVLDVSRSTSYLLPSILLATMGMLRFSNDTLFIRRVMLIVACICVIIPTMYICKEPFWMSPIFPKVFKLM
jgi:hypothetical protein